MRKVTGGYDGASQEILENIARVESVPVKMWDMRVRASARILEESVQEDLIEEVERHRGRDRSGRDRSLAWATVKSKQFNTSLEGALASMGENGERKISWDFNQTPRAPQNLRETDRAQGASPRLCGSLESDVTRGCGMDGMLHQI